MLYLNTKVHILLGNHYKVCNVTTMDRSLKKVSHSMPVTEGLYLIWKIRLGPQMNEIMYCCGVLLEHVLNFVNVFAKDP